VRYTVPTLTFIIREYEKLKRCYDLVNNNINGFKEEFKRFCDPLGELDSVAIEEEILPFNMIHNKINIFRDGAIKRRPRHHVVSITSDEIKNKTEEYKAFVQKKVMEQMMQMIDIAKMPPEQQEQAKQEFLQQNLPEGFGISNFRTAWERFYERVLKWAELTMEIKDKKVETMDDIVIADRCILYVGWRGDKPVIEVCNPLFTGFHKSPNEKWIQKGDYVYTTRSITAVDVITEYGDKLTEEEMQRLGLYANGPTIADPRFDVRGGNAVPVRSDWDELLYRENWPGEANASKFVGTHMTQAGTIRDRYRSLIWCTHIEFKAFREVYFLNYIDEYGKTITEVLSEDFKIPKDAKKSTAIKHGEEIEIWEWTEGETAYILERLWIPWKYELTRLMGDVYVNCREVPNQTVDVNDPYGKFELSYKGRVFSDRNSESVSLVERAIPYQFQAFYINHVINRELAKYKGFVQDVDVDQIPDGLGQDFEGNQIRDKFSVWLTYLKKEGYNFFSGSQNSFGGLPPSTRSPGSNGYFLGSADQLFALKRLLDYVNTEISLAMGLSPQREAQANQQLTATDNERNAAASYAITEYFFDQHEEVWAHVLNSFLNNFRHYYRQKIAEDNSKEYFLSYVMPDGTQELFAVTPEILDHEGVGLFVKTGSSEQEYRQMMIQSVFAIAQNAGQGASTVSELIKMITEGETPDTIHRKLLLLEEKQQKRQEEMQKAQMESQEKMVQMQVESREDQQKHEIDKIIIAEQLRKDREMELKVLDTYKFQENLNMDKDGVPDQLEALKVYQQMENDKRKLDQVDKKLELEREKIHKMLSKNTK